MPPLDPHLRRLHVELESAMARIAPEHWNWHLPGKWSTAEIVEHLYLTYTGTIKGAARVLDAKGSLASSATWKNRAQAFVVVSLGYLPEGRQSPPQARPRGLAAEKVMREVLPAISEMDEILTRCADQFGARSNVLDHPFLGPFSIAQWRKFHLLHGLHHVKQIRRLQQTLNTKDASTSREKAKPD